MIKIKTARRKLTAESLLEQLESLSQLRKQAKQRLLAQARPHADYRILIKLPGFGPVRVAQLIAVVCTPHRFRTKRQFWPYCGYAIVTRSSADYQIVEGKIVKQRKKVSTVHVVIDNAMMEGFSLAPFARICPGSAANPAITHAIPCLPCAPHSKAG